MYVCTRGFVCAGPGLPLGSKVSVPHPAWAAGPAPAGTQLTLVSSCSYPRELLTHLATPEPPSLTPSHEESHAS